MSNGHAMSLLPGQAVTQPTLGSHTLPRPFAMRAVVREAASGHIQGWQMHCGAAIRQMQENSWISASGDVTRHGIDAGGHSGQRRGWLSLPASLSGIAGTANGGEGGVAPSPAAYVRQSSHGIGTLNAPMDRLLSAWSTKWAGASKPSNTPE